MKSVFGTKPKTYTDVVKYEADVLEIYVGLLAYEESVKAHEAIGYGDYSITRIGNKIVVAAYESNILKAAVNDLIDSIKSVSSAEKLMLPKDFEHTKTVVKMLSSLPKVKNDTPKAYCIADSSSYTYVVEDCAQRLFDDYKSALEETAFTKHASQKIADNSFATYHNDVCVVNMSYFPKEKALHIAVDNKKYTDMPEASAQSFSRVGATNLNLLGVSAAGNDENGFSMFVRLADGRFLVWDGGGGDPSADADNLYSKLKASAQEVNVEKVVIAGWFLTHCHGDHASTYLSFLPKYASEVEIQKLIISPTSYEYGKAVKDGAQYESNVITQTMFKSKNTDVIVARTGQRFYFADVTIDILFTLDALMPFEFNNYNLASVVSRVQIGDKVLITTGDCATEAWNFLCDVYGDYLKCDYLQIPHHGAIPGGTVEAYELLDPDYLLWPAGPNVFNTITGEGYTGHKINLHILDTMNLREKTYLAGNLGSITTLTF